MPGSDRREISFQITVATEGGGELQGRTKREGSAPYLQERTLNRFVRFVALVEWAGNAFGALAFLWATGVLLGGFCTSLKPEDFWFATVMIFIEAFRIFSRDYKVENQSLFGTTKALRWISSSFTRMLWQPQQGDEVMLYMGLWINLTEQLPLGGFLAIPQLALLVLMSRRPQWPQGFQTWVLLIAYLALAAYQFCYGLTTIDIPTSFSRPHPFDAISAGRTIFGGMVAVVAVLLLKLRPRRITNLTSSPFGRKLISFAKGIAALWLVSDLVLDIVLPSFDESAPSFIDYYCITALTEVVLLLGSLQAPENSNQLGRWIDAILRVCFLWDLVFPLDYISDILGPNPNPTRPVIAALSFFTLVVLLMIGNLQVPAAIIQVLLSSLRFHALIDHHDYYQLTDESSKNMVPALEVFYILAMCQGSLYIMASILGIFSFFPRRSLVRRSKLGGRRGAKAIDLYYHRAYAMCMDSGLLAARKTMSLASFAMECLCSSNSSGMQLVGLILLDNLLSKETESSEELKSRIISSNKALSMLIRMLGWSGGRDRDIRQFAARITAKLADNIRIAGSIVKLVSSLLDATDQNQPVPLLNFEQVTADNATSVGPINEERVTANQSAGDERSALATSGIGRWSWVCQWMKERWSIPEEPLLSYKDSLPLLGMAILEKFACDLDNCEKLVKVSGFIPKIIGLISYTTDKENSSYDQQNGMICLSLHLLRRLASTGGKIDGTVRQKLWESPFLLDNLAGVFENCRSSPEVWTPAMDIISKLALDEDARQEIGSNQVIIGKLLHSFLGRAGPQDQLLRLAAGEALVNLSIESTANCSAMMEESGYDITKDLKDMLCEPEYRVYTSVAASLLQNLCAYSREKLISRPGAAEHLRSTIPVVMKNIVSAEGKQLETFIGLASQICSFPECFTFEFVSHTNEVGGLVKKLVDTLNSNRKPSPEYPRMRRVIVEMVISLATMYPGYRTMFRDEGMMEALSKAARTPSRVEKYRVFSGDEGVVVESGEPLRHLVDRAKGLISTPTPTLALD